jgi:hypothetical protein
MCFGSNALDRRIGLADRGPPPIRDAEHNPNAQTTSYYMLARRLDRSSGNLQAAAEISHHMETKRDSRDLNRSGSLEDLQKRKY